MPDDFLIILPIVIVLLLTHENNKMAAVWKITTLKNPQEAVQMQELAKRFIGKECIIYTFNSQLTGTIMEVGEGAVVLKNKTSNEIVNLEFVVRIREYPVNRKGKKASVVLD